MHAQQPSVVLVDFGGHPFTADLASSLQRSGAVVRYVFSSSNEINPHGDFRDVRNEGVTVDDVDLGRPIDPMSPRRFVDQQQFGWKVAALLRQAPHGSTVILCQVPVAAALIILGAAKASKHRVVLWMQALQSDLSAGTGLRAAKGKIVDTLERRVISGADRVIAISDGFADYARDARGDDDGVTVLPNWAPLRYLPSRSRVNAWSNARGLDPDRRRVIYSGRMGNEHRPDEIAALSLMLTGNDDIDVVLVAAGPGVESLERRSELSGHPRIHFVELQPLSDLADVLGSADVLLGTLDDRASEALVPSKILSYLCAARPVVAMMKATNPSAELIREIDAGIVVDNVHEAATSIRTLFAEPDLMRRMGNRGRAYATTAFDPLAVATRFAAAADL